LLLGIFDGASGDCMSRYAAQDICQCVFATSMQPWAMDVAQESNILSLNSDLGFHATTESLVNTYYFHCFMGFTMQNVPNGIPILNTKGNWEGLGGVQFPENSFEVVEETTAREFFTGKRPTGSFETTLPSVHVTLEGGKENFVKVGGKGQGKEITVIHIDRTHKGHTGKRDGMGK